MAMELHEAMVAELGKTVVPSLRSKGFRGTFPHFRRDGSHGIDLLTFQFDKNGGGFVVEIAHCSSEGITAHWGKHIPPNKVRAWDIDPDNRLRIKSRVGSGTDSWFRFDDGQFSNAAQQIINELPQAETWWQSRT
jgi:hypothetical protein